MKKEVGDLIKRHTHKSAEKRIKGGMFNIILDLRYGIIENIKISGDFSIFNQ